MKHSLFSLQLIRNNASIPAFILCLLLVISSGCATTGGKSYTREEARNVQTIEYGVIVSMDEVSIEQDTTILGPGIGGVLGGIIGSTMGAKSGRLLMTAGGAAIGAALGALGEKTVRTEKAQEIVVRLENGRTISVVQAVDNTLTPGSNVRVLYGASNRARVVLNR